MTRTRLSAISTTAFVSIVGAAVPAFAQAPMAPAPMMAPAPVMAPAMAPAPMAPAPEAVMPVAPMMAPKAADDMSGSVGFGVGIVGGSTGEATNGSSTGNILIAPNTADLMMKYWLNDAMALLPKLSFGLSKSKSNGVSTDMAWSLAPSLLADFTLLKGASTRFSAGVGLGLAFGKTPPATDTAISINVPVTLNVEHFFTRWFSMGVGARFNLIDYAKVGDNYAFSFEVSNINYMGSLFFYTD
jgi:hypothetical protein